MEEGRSDPTKVPRKWLGLDLGQKTIGIALSDDLGMTAQPLKTLRRRGLDKDLEEIIGLACRQKVRGIVVGLPKNMDGSLGAQARGVLQFTEILKDRSGLAVLTWDERLSTAAVTKVLLQADVSRRKRRQVVDKLAAVHILQGFLDAAGRDKAQQGP